MQVITLSCLPLIIICVVCKMILFTKINCIVQMFKVEIILHIHLLKLNLQLFNFPEFECFYVYNATCIMHCSYGILPWKVHCVMLIVFFMTVVQISGLFWHRPYHGWHTHFMCKLSNWEYIMFYLWCILYNGYHMLHNKTGIIYVSRNNLDAMSTPFQDNEKHHQKQEQGKFRMVNIVISICHPHLVDHHNLWWMIF